MASVNEPCPRRNHSGNQLPLVMLGGCLGGAERSHLREGNCLVPAAPADQLGDSSYRFYWKPFVAFSPLTVCSRFHGIRTGEGRRRSSTCPMQATVPLTVLPIHLSHRQRVVRCENTVK
jgi:hypothetical protein